MEAYNLTNAIMWTAPITNLTNAQFGQIPVRATNQGRSLQYTARIHF